MHLMYLTFLFYLPDDGHMVGRNMYEVNVQYTLILIHLCASVGTTYIYYSINARIMDHKGTKCVHGKNVD
jgi:hypothetical protein